jgi:hypothetical protein
MFKKILLAGVFALTTAVGAFAADTLAMSLNFYSDKGAIVPAGDFPAGVLMGKQIKFPAKSKLSGYAWPVSIEIDRAPSIELQFTVKGSGNLLVSLNPEIWRGGKVVSRMKVKCTRFVMDVKPKRQAPFTFGAKDPFTFGSWTRATREIRIEDGDVITIKAEFEKVE